MKTWISKLPAHCVFVNNIDDGCQLYAKLPDIPSGDIVYCLKYPNGMIRCWRASNKSSLLYAI